MTTTDLDPGRALVGSVLRAMRLLDLFERGRPEMSLAEFARRSGYTKSTTYRLLLTLVEAGWLERSSAGAFRLTIKAFQVGSVLVDSLELRREAGPVMARLAAELDETVYLVVAADTRASGDLGLRERHDGSHDALDAERGEDASTRAAGGRRHRPWVGLSASSTAR